jgi:hypothetical protein
VTPPTTTDPIANNARLIDQGMLRFLGARRPSADGAATVSPERSTLCPASVPEIAALAAIAGVAGGCMPPTDAIEPDARAGAHAATHATHRVAPAGVRR